MAVDLRLRVGRRPPAGRVSALHSLFALPFAGFGLGALAVGVAQIRAGNTPLGVAGLGFGVVFTGIGVLLAVAVRSGLRAEREAEARQARHPDEPWRWSGRWDDPRLRSAGRGGVLSVWVFALLWNAISAPALLLLVPRVLGEGRLGHAAGAALFPLLGLLLLGWAVRVSLQHRRFGVSILELARVPGTLGGELAATLHAGASLGEARELALRLACIRQVTTGSGKDRSTHEQILWADEASLPLAAAARGPEGLALPVRFALPADAPASDPLPCRSPVLWRLEARASLSGVDYEAVFEVPVFATRETRPERTAEALALERTAPAHAGAASTVSRVVVRPHPSGGTEIFFPPGRHAPQALVAALFAAIFGGGAAVAHAHQAPLPVVILCAAVAGIVVWAALSLAFGSTRIVASREGVERRHRLFGLGRTRRLAADQIASVTVETGMQSGRRIFWDLRLLGRAPALGRAPSLRLGGSLHEKRDAEHLAAVVRQALGR